MSTSESPQPFRHLPPGIFYILLLTDIYLYVSFSHYTISSFKSEIQSYLFFLLFQYFALNQSKKTVLVPTIRSLPSSQKWFFKDIIAVMLLHFWNSLVTFFCPWSKVHPSHWWTPCPVIGPLPASPTARLGSLTALSCVREGPALLPLRLEGCSFSSQQGCFFLSLQPELLCCFFGEDIVTSPSTLE